MVKQSDAVGLLTVGSKASPKEDILRIGDAGTKQLVQLKQDGEGKGLSALFEKDKNTRASVFGPNGLPPFPCGMSRVSSEGGRWYVMDADREEGFPEEYVSLMLLNRQCANVRCSVGILVERLYSGAGRYWP